jgi:hypothetical protein
LEVKGWGLPGVFKIVDEEFLVLGIIHRKRVYKEIEKKL